MANSFYMDASALAKRYIPEKGNELVDEILNKVPSSRIHFLNIGAGEILSVLVRRRNAGTLSIANFQQAVANFNAEIVRWAAVTRASVTTRLVATSLPLIIAHSINSTDALILKSALAISRTSCRRRSRSDRLGPAPPPRRPGGRAGHIQSGNPGSSGAGSTPRPLARRPEAVAWAGQKLLPGR